MRKDTIKDLALIVGVMIAAPPLGVGLIFYTLWIAKLLVNLIGLPSPG